MVSTNWLKDTSLFQDGLVKLGQECILYLMFPNQDIAIKPGKCTRLPS